MKRFKYKTVKVRNSETKLFDDVLALKGAKGNDGDVSFDELTDAQKRSLMPYVGKNKNWWICGEDTGHRAEHNVVSGSYVGDGSDTVGIPLDHIPKLIFVFGNECDFTLMPENLVGVVRYTADEALDDSTYVTRPRVGYLTLSVSNNTITVSGGIYYSISSDGVTYNYTYID